MNIIKQLGQLARQAKGSHKTIHDRQVIVERFGQYLKSNNIQIKTIAQIKSKYIEGYIHSRMDQDLNKRTLQNEMAAIRVTLRMAGRDKLADSERISNKILGIGNASRAGTKEAITPAQYQQIFEHALAKDQGLAATIQLARALGLRGEEAVQSIFSLKTWQTALDNGASKLKVVFGTKGGRPRETTIIDRNKVTQAVSFALQVAKTQNGKLIDKPNLKTAMTYWRNQTTAIGLTGKISPHSLRYAWVQEAIQYYQQLGYTMQEAKALTAMDLGHGDGRGRYVAWVYGLIIN